MSKFAVLDMCNDYISSPFCSSLLLSYKLGMEFKQKPPRLILPVELQQGVDLWFLKGKAIMINFVVSANSRGMEKEGISPNHLPFLTSCILHYKICNSLIWFQFQAWIAFLRKFPYYSYLRLFLQLTKLFNLSFLSLPHSRWYNKTHLLY